MREAHAGCIAVLHRREHGAEEQHRAIGILVMPADHLIDQLLRIAADLADIARAFEHEAVGARDVERDARAAHVVEREGAVEQADEGSDRRRGVVVLGLGEEERGAPLDVAQVHVIAERRADDFAF
jgi:hypothetical protein